MSNKNIPLLINQVEDEFREKLNNLRSKNAPFLYFLKLFHEYEPLFKMYLESLDNNHKMNISNYYHRFENPGATGGFRVYSNCYEHCSEAYEFWYNFVLKDKYMTEEKLSEYSRGVLYTTKRLFELNTQYRPVLVINGKLYANEHYTPNEPDRYLSHRDNKEYDRLLHFLERNCRNEKDFLEKRKSEESEANRVIKEGTLFFFGQYTCEVCEKVLRQTYNLKGVRSDYCHLHHKYKSKERLKPKYNPYDPENSAILCPDCHEMIHQVIRKHYKYIVDGKNKEIELLRELYFQDKLPKYEKVPKLTYDMMNDYYRVYKRRCKSEPLLTRYLPVITNQLPTFVNLEESVKNMHLENMHKNEYWANVLKRNGDDYERIDDTLDGD